MPNLQIGMTYGVSYLVVYRDLLSTQRCIAASVFVVVYTIVEDH